MITVLVLSCHRNNMRRHWTRDLWANEVSAFASVRFLLGKSADGFPSLGNDEWELDIPDDYKHLPHKVHAGLARACREFPGRPVFKCDDDTFVSPSAFRAFVVGAAGHRYTGCPVSGHDNPIPFAHGGAGYYLSAFAAQTLVDRMPVLVGEEDRIVGYTMTRLGMPLWTDLRFMGDWHPSILPGRGNDLITMHRVDCMAKYQLLRNQIHGNRS